MFSYLWTYFEEDVEADEKSKRQKYLVLQQIRASKMKLKKIDRIAAFDCETIRYTKKEKRKRRKHKTVAFKFLILLHWNCIQH